MIIESGIVTATTTDLLSGGRLNNIPYNGKLILQFQSDNADATNSYSLTVQKPDGSVPIDTQLVPAGAAGTAGVLDSREYLELAFTATQGGHFHVALTETGTAVCTWRAVLSP